jgi:subtilisin family serine protease
MPGEVVVRFRSDFPECAHCLFSEGRGFSATTGTRVLDQLALRYGIRRIDPLFGGLHETDRHRRALERFGGSAAGEADLSAVQELGQTYVVKTAPGVEPGVLAQELRRDPNILWAEPNYIYQTAGNARGLARLEDPGVEDETLGSGPPLTTLEARNGNALPDDPFLASSGSWGQDFPDLWGLYQIEAPEAWEHAQGEGVVVAVVDTGLDVEHPDIAANVWQNPGEVAGNGIDDDGNGFADDVNGWDFTRCSRLTFSGCLDAETKEPGPEVTDRQGHGTHVAGTIAAVGGNGVGIIGVAPKASVMPVKALSDTGLGVTGEMAQGIIYAAENGARVINASWDGPPSETMREAVEYVTRTFDAVVVAAAGNNHAPLARTRYPAALPDVLTVGATTETDAVASFSKLRRASRSCGPGRE